MGKLIDASTAPFKKPKTPRAPKPIAMPDPEQIERDKRRNYDQRLASGRTSTILTDTLG